MSGDLGVRLAGTLGAFALDAAFTAPGRGVTALFGRSGSGKTSILRAVAGLQRLDGRVSLGSDVWQEGARFVPPHKRPVGYVFQEASLFPHLSVAQNLAFGRRRALRGGASEEVRHADVVELLGLGRLLDRSPAKLSGGERQRVAVGRALLSQPRLLLMDEPLSGLDAVSKEEILPYFEALHETLAIPALYVSHDLAEITRLADHLVVLDKGRVLAAGPLAHVLLQRLPGVFGLGRSSVLYARVRSYDEREELTELDLAGQPLLAVGRAGATSGLVRVRIAASDVSLSPGAPSRTTILNTLRARIVSIEPLAGGQVSVGLALDSAEPDPPRLLALISRRSLETLGFTVGQEVFAQVKSVAMLTARQP